MAFLLFEFPHDAEAHSIGHWKPVMRDIIEQSRGEHFAMAYVGSRDLDGVVMHVILSPGESIVSLDEKGMPGIVCTADDGGERP